MCVLLPCVFGGSTTRRRRQTPTPTPYRFKQWCAQLQARKGPNSYNVLLIPGDIASHPVTFRTALEAAQASFDQTFICAGNHDLWHSSSLQAE
jgi:hypothetical protein